MGPHAHSVHQEKKLSNMKSLFAGNFFRKYGRKALIIYLCWCILKGLFFLFIGYKMFG